MLADAPQSCERADRSGPYFQASLLKVHLPHGCRKTVACHESVWGPGATLSDDNLHTDPLRGL